MIECIFTIDYEIYGNGAGSLAELVYDPAEKLSEVFCKWGVPLVVFVEAAEFEMIELHNTDSDIGRIKSQLTNFHNEGFEIALHIHPQWYNGIFHHGRWILDNSEYNLCTLTRSRVVEIVRRAITYLGNIMGQPDFSPISFRAGNWLLQPTGIISDVLAGHGIKVDSSVFKGGLQRQHKLDYRPALKNGYYWKFTNDVNCPDAQGLLIEVPIHTEMVPTWKLLTLKRLGIQHKGSSSAKSNKKHLTRILDYFSLHSPLKFDFSRMTIQQMKQTVRDIVRKDKDTPSLYKPIVLIGHTKDSFDSQAVDSFLSYLFSENISITTFRRAYTEYLNEGS